MALSFGVRSSRVLSGKHSLDADVKEVDAHDDDLV
jgi:hypothetical protein